jgi:hypothetical protein
MLPFVTSFENRVLSSHTDPHPSLSRKKRARVRKESVEKFPRPFRWERVRVRAILSSGGERNIMNYFVV